MSALSLADAIRGRRSVRRFRDEPVARELILELLELACLAPSAGNRQDWGFTVVTSREKIAGAATVVRERWAVIVEANRARGFAEELEKYSATFSWFDVAPVLIAVSARAVDGVQRHIHGDELVASAVSGSAASAAMAAQNLMLAAHERGLGSCCLTGPLAAGNELTELLKLNRRRELICLVALGWPAEHPPPRNRRPLKEVAEFLE